MNSNKFEEAKNKVIFSAERLAERYFLNKFGSAKFSKEPKVTLEAVEGATSDSYSFTGKIRCYASTPVLEGYSEVGLDLTVNNNDVSVEADETVESKVINALNSSDDYSPTEDILTASLDSFQLVDNNNGYLSVSHSSLADATLGVVSQKEYAISPNKSELLQTIVKDAMTRIPSEHVKVAFIGEFKEPTIGKYSDIIPIESITKKAEQEFIPSQETQSDDLPLARMSGGVEKAIQADEQKAAFEIDKLSNQAINKLIPTLQSLGYGSARVSEITPNLSHSDNGVEGSIDVMAFVEDSTSTKLVSLPIKIRASQIELPKVNLIKELVQKAINLNERLTEQLTKEALLSLSAVDEKVEYEKNYVESILKEDNKIEKVATENGLSGVQLVGPQDSLVLQKHLLPLDAQDMKVGDVVFADNSYYKLVDTEGMQNDKNAQSSSLWKFVKCEPPKEDKNPAIRIPE